jgi:uncharacterized membrane protein
MKLSDEAKQKIVAAILAAEAETSGEIRVHLSYAKKEEHVMEHAQKQFAKLSMHETKHRNGMLLYLNPRLRKFAIFGDEGIHKAVGQKFWDHLAHEVRDSIREKDMVAGITHAVLKMGAELKTNFPHEAGGVAELSSDVSESD